MLHDYLISLIRTAVPAAAGAVLAWAASLGLDLGAEAQVGLVTFGTALLTAVYYAVVRALETRWPVFGKLLGKQTAVAYEPHRKPVSS